MRQVWCPPTQLLSAKRAVVPSPHTQNHVDTARFFCHDRPEHPTEADPLCSHDNADSLSEHDTQDSVERQTVNRPSPGPAILKL